MNTMNSMDTFTFCTLRLPPKKKEKGWSRNKPGKLLAKEDLPFLAFPVMIILQIWDSEC
jgi:hypothetical protein